MRRTFFLIFFVSGFSGLIYESLWTQYLKLFLGHAAYAQALVLAIYMGGLALGSWISGRLSERITSVLTAYAIAEAVIGVFALAFHPVFEAATGYAYSAVLPGMTSITAAHVFRFTLGALLVLPQTILLGMTFPFMSAGLLRRSPGEPGRVLATLYFSNSLGGVFGALAGTFVLVPLFGLPGSIRFAGVLNLLIAAWVLSVADEKRAPVPAAQAVHRPAWRAAAVLLYAAAAITGLSSFVYEVAWIRLLALVLGSSTHAFEIMLSVFILGLALGGWWIRKRADGLTAPLTTLALIQILMGVLAVATLPAYVLSFDAVRWLLTVIPRTDVGYAAFNSASYLLAAAVMLPATFCAGMTLPLITLVFLREGRGERAIGAVYGLNTAGAIAGVFLAVFVGFEALGLKNLLVAGAAVDVALGAALLAVAPRGRRRLILAAGVPLGIAVLAWAGSAALDQTALASGVYRTTTQQLAPSQVVRYADGRTASISITRGGQGWLSIRTNGKPDASIAQEGTPFSPDEATATLLGAMPQLLRPGPASVAVIGVGSGLTSDTALAAEAVTSVDSIEIEPAVVELAKVFRPRNERLYADPRSRIVIDDAKSFFAVGGRKYDAIISEPSNPWVSGVAGLFTSEFYRAVRAHLAQGGVFVQWLQVYEIDQDCVASVLKTLSAEFSDYVVYTSNYRGDLIIVATAGGAVPPVQAAAFGDAGFARVLAHVGVAGPQDITARTVAHKRTLDAWIDEALVPANSDYYPYLDVHANQARFMLAEARDFRDMAYEPLPVDELLSGAPQRFPRTEATDVPSNPLGGPARAVAVLDLFAPAGAKAASGRAAESVEQMLALCRAEWSDKTDAALAFSFRALLFLQPQEFDSVWSRLGREPCFKHLERDEPDWAALITATARRKPEEMALHAHALLESGRVQNADYFKALLSAGMLGEIMAGRPEMAGRLWTRFGPNLGPLVDELPVRVLAAASRDPQRKRP